MKIQYNQMDIVDYPASESTLPQCEKRALAHGAENM